MDPKIISKITRVHPNFITRSTPAGDHTTGPYWFGYYQVKGKTIRVYIGRKLPAELEVLLGTRIKFPGHQYFTWPGKAQAA